MLNLKIFIIPRTMPVIILIGPGKLAEISRNGPLGKKNYGLFSIIKWCKFFLIVNFICTLCKSLSFKGPVPLNISQFVTKVCTIVC